MPLITEEQLKKIYKRCQPEKVKLYTQAFNAVWPQYEINTPKRIAAFLGQIAVESGELRYDKELPSQWNKKNVNDPNEPIGTLYEGRKNLGNTQAGDGPKFIGRGILQLTGRANYADYSKKLSIDLIKNPDLVCSPDISVKIACQYFKDRKLLQLADAWDLAGITRKVNGNAMLHHDKRAKYSEAALQVLNADAPIA